VRIYLNEPGSNLNVPVRAAGRARPCSRRLGCNPARLLDPYAKAVEGSVDWTLACFPYDFGDENFRNGDGSAPHVPRSVVHNPFFDCGSDRSPDVPLNESIIYEVHVKGEKAGNDRSLPVAARSVVVLMRRDAPASV
jgi:pullulanase/glycogen debranching enzyme